MKGHILSSTWDNMFSFLEFNAEFAPVVMERGAQKYFQLPKILCDQVILIRVICNRWHDYSKVIFYID